MDSFEHKPTVDDIANADGFRELLENFSNIAEFNRQNAALLRSMAEHCPCVTDQQERFLELCDEAADHLEPLVRIYQTLSAVGGAVAEE